MTRTLIVVLIVVTLGVFAGFAISGSKPAASKATVSKLVSSYNDFGFQLFRKLASAKPGDNTVISPASISIAMSMAYEGSAGTSRTAIAKGLGIQTLPPDQVGAANSALLTRLGMQTSGATLNVANSIWIDKAASMQSAYTSRIQASYKAYAGNLDFTNPSSIPTINAWVSQETQGKIGSVVDRLDPGSVLLLVNTVYFKGSWKAPFDKSATTLGAFTSAQNKQLQVQFMRKSDTFSYLENSLFQAVEMPYKDKNASMFVLLPKSGVGLTGLQAKLTAANWKSWMSSFGDMEGTVALPRMELKHETRDTLKSTLSNLGMGVIFDPQAANFSRMCRIPPSPPVYVSSIIHKAIVEVNEEGTVAAADTGIVMRAASAPVPPRLKPFEMIVDRPFLFIIRENHTGLILFIGSVTDPTKQ